MSRSNVLSYPQSLFVSCCVRDPRSLEISGTTDPDPSHPQPALSDRVLSDREAEVLCWISEGKSDWEIGNILTISPKTVNYHVENAKRKLGAITRLNAVVVAMRHGLIALAVGVWPLTSFATIVQPY